MPPETLLSLFIDILEFINTKICDIGNNICSKLISPSLTDAMRRSSENPEISTYSCFIHC